jgi:PTS system galactitol-specific IIA component
MQKNIFSKDLIFIDPPIDKADRNTIINYLCEKLVEKDIITAEYTRAVLEREKTHPTGLPTMPYASTVPHANPIGVKRTGIALAVLKKPIPFFAMDNPEKELEVRLVFLMSFLDGKQVALLRWISNILSDQKTVKGITESTSPDQAYQIIAPFLQKNSKGEK